MNRVTLENKSNGKLKNERTGFAWAALLFNCFYLLYRKDWIAFGACILVYSLFSFLPNFWYGVFFIITSIAICFLYNRARIEYLLHHGWSAKAEIDDQILFNYNIHTSTNKGMSKDKSIPKDAYIDSSNKNEETTTPSTFEKVSGVLSALSSLGGIHCPRCFSKNVQVVGQHKKGFSAGKAIAGTALAGGIGSLAGFAGKKTKKVDMICLDCGKKFRK